MFEPGNNNAPTGEAEALSHHEENHKANRETPRSLSIEEYTVGSVPSQHAITILTGSEDYYRACKTFKLMPDPRTGAPVPSKVSDYAMGKKFYHRQESLAVGAELASWQELLGRMEEDTQSFRVYGYVAPDEGELTFRRDPHILDPGNIRLFEVDIDGWKTNSRWWMDEKLLDRAIQELLEQRGLGYLCGVEYVVVLSQSAWAGGKLKCHLYFWIADGQGFTMEEMRAWAMAVNTRLGSKEIDGSAYKAVQPDYTARRICTGMKDPIDKRIFRIDGEPGQIGEGIQAELMQSSQAGSSGRGGTAGEIELSGDGWETLKLTGTGSEVNVYCYRAAAKIVQAVGGKAVLERLQFYATRMHTAAWAVMAENSNNVRGKKEDRETYSVKKFAQFLRSACDRRFGDDLDNYKGIVEEAMATGPKAMYGREVIKAAATLKNRWKPEYVELRASITLMKGVQVSDWSNDVDRKAKTLAKISREDEAGALTETDGAGKPNPKAFFDKEKGLIELPFCNVVGSTYDLISDGKRDIILDRWDIAARDDGGYLTIGAKDSIRDHITARAMEILDGLCRLPDGMIMRITGVLNLHFSKAKKSHPDGKAPSREHGERYIERRFHQVPHTLRSGGAVIWVNLGIVDGKYLCVRCDKEGIRCMTWLASLEKYKDAPIWESVTAPLTKALKDGDFIPVGGSYEGDQCFRERGYEWVDNLFKMIRLEKNEDEGGVIAREISVILNWDTKFMMEILGVKGYGKSVVADVLNGIVDPVSDINNLSRLKDDRLQVDALDKGDIYRSLSGKCTALIDNVSYLSKVKQDRLCGVATGMSKVDRVLYTDFDLIRRVEASLCITAVSPVVTRPDLADRVLSVYVRHPKRGAGFVDNLEGFFEESRGDIFMGLLVFAVDVMLEVSKNPSEWTDRDALPRLVNDMYWGDSSRELQRVREVTAAAELVEKDHFSSCFCAWLQNDTESWDIIGRLQGRTMTTTKLYEEYKAWFRKNAGRIVGVQTSVDTGFEVTLTSSAGSGRKKQIAVPTNSISMGAKLARYGEVIELVGGRLKQSGRLRIERRQTNAGSMVTITDW